MSRYIDANAYLHELEELIRARLEWIRDGRNEIQGLNVAICALEDQPTVDVVSKEKYDELNERYHRLLESAKILSDAVREYERREDDYKDLC